MGIALLPSRAGALIVALVVLVGSCRRAEPRSELLVFAAASTSDALTELGRRFEEHGGPHTVFSFGSSRTLARQIVAGAAADVFLSADDAAMKQLEQAGLADPAERKNLLSNRLVIVVPSDSSARVDGARSLQGFARIAVGDPATVPAGAYAKQWLESEGVWAEVHPRIVPTLDVRAALAAVESRHAEAGIVYRTDAATSPHVRIAHEVTSHAPEIVYPLVRVKTSKNPAAVRFIELLDSPEGGEVFVRHGFVVL